MMNDPSLFGETIADALSTDPVRMEDAAADRELLDPAAEKKRRALLKEFGLSTELEEAPDRLVAIRLLVLLGCVTLFVAAMFFPVMTYVRGANLTSTFPTWVFVLLGWAFVPQVFEGSLWACAWLANVTLVGVMIELGVRQERWAVIAAALGVVFAALGLTLEAVPINGNGPAFPVASFEPGLYLWQAAMVLAFAGSSLLWWLDDSVGGAAGEETEPPSW